MFYWTDQKVDLYKRAAEYTGFNDKIGEIVLSLVGEGRSIWDLGCGVSYLSLYLAPYMEVIDCVDKSEEALEGLEELAKNLDLKNIRIHKQDYRLFLKERKRVDCLLLSNFLRVGDNLGGLLDLADSLVFIRNSRTRKEEGLFPGKKQTIEDIEDLILEYDRNMDYKKIIYEGDFGQPLLDLEEACQYYESYRDRRISKAEVEGMLDFKNEGDYPYYFPKNKSVGIIFIDRR